jgi:hypothetical protein
MWPVPDVRLLTDREFWLYVVAPVVAIILAVLLWNVVSAPFVWLGERFDAVFCVSAECKLERAEAERDRLKSEVSARLEEREAREALRQAVERSNTVILETRTITERAVTEAEGAPDADTPLDPARADRLRAHDRGLCDLAPESCAVAPDG